MGSTLARRSAGAASPVLRFDGGDYLELAYNASLDPASALTLAVVCRSTATSRVVVGRPYAATHSDPYFNWLLYHGGSTNDLSMRVNASDVIVSNLGAAIPTANACALEPLRLLTNSQQAAAASAGVARADIVLSWVFTTQSITPVLQTLLVQNQAATATVAPTGQTTAVAGLPPVADIYIGVLPVPYYLEAPSAQNPTAVLTTFWKGRPGNYIGPFAQAGLDPNSTNLTIANRAPDRRSTQNVPLILTVPNAASQRTKPANGWPIVIFTHGITRNRTGKLQLVLFDFSLCRTPADNITPSKLTTNVRYTESGARYWFEYGIRAVIAPSFSPIFQGKVPFGDAACVALCRTANAVD